MLSLCMIVKDETENLSLFLPKLKSFVDEIVIIDTGSTDDTINTAKKFTNKVFSFKWVDDFSKAKNYAISKAKGDWILFLDADELITEEDFKKIRSLVTEKNDAFRLQVLNYLNDKLPGAKVNNNFQFNHPFCISFRLTRLFRNKGYLYKYRIHELIEDSIEEAKGVIKEANVQIHHFGTLKLKDKKTEYYETLVLKQLEEYPQDKRTLYYAGEVYWTRKDVDKSIELFEKVSLIDPSYKNIHAKIGQLYFAKNQLSKAIEHYIISIKYIKEAAPKAHLINQLAFLYHRNNQDALAKELLENFLKENALSNEMKSLLNANLSKLS